MSSIKKFRGSRKIVFGGKTYKTATPVYEFLLRGGWPIATIARKLEVTYPAVLAYKQAQEEKGKTYPRVTNKLHESYMRAAVAITLAQNKWSRKEIAKALKVTYAAVAFMLKTACVKVPDLRKVENHKLRMARA